ncbi:MAG TPA: hypothetical protein VFT41_06335, partial [Gemmatimonadaceae bacterium]|nr:hypothetical protein [Gemmatimonadaceae bacterium]
MKYCSQTNASTARYATDRCWWSTAWPAPGTTADREAEHLITAALAAAYPEAVLLGEETYAERKELMQEFWAADHAF